MLRNIENFRNSNLYLQQIRQTGKNCSHVRVIRAQDFLLDGQRTAVNWTQLIVLTLEKNTKVKNNTVVIDRLHSLSKRSEVNKLINQHP